MWRVRVGVLVDALNATRPKLGTDTRIFKSLSWPQRDRLDSGQISFRLSSLAYRPKESGMFGGVPFRRLQESQARIVATGTG